MMTTDLLALIYGADRKYTYEQFRSWVGEGFISDDQMRVLNITIRRAVHEALGQVDLACHAVTRLHRLGLHTEEQAALEFCEFQVRTIRDYMEPPGSPELEEAYQRYVREPDVNR